MNRGASYNTSSLSRSPSISLLIYLSVYRCRPFITVIIDVHAERGERSRRAPSNSIDISSTSVQPSIGRIFMSVRKSHERVTWEYISIIARRILEHIIDDIIAAKWDGVVGSWDDKDEIKILSLIAEFLLAIFIRRKMQQTFNWQGWG